MFIFTPFCICANLLINMNFNPYSFIAMDGMCVVVLMALRVMKMVYKIKIKKNSIDKMRWFCSWQEHTTLITKHNTYTTNNTSTSRHTWEISNQREKKVEKRWEDHHKSATKHLNIFAQNKHQQKRLNKKCIEQIVEYVHTANDKTSKRN